MSQIPSGAVIVGVSTRSGSPAALQWGQQYAKANKLPLVAVMVYSKPRPPATAGTRPPATTVIDADTAEEAAVEKLTGYVQRALGKKSGATLGLLRGAPATALRKLSAEAELIVLGSPRETTLAAQRVAAKLIHDASCPVLVMPPVSGTVPPSRVKTAGKKLAKATAEAAARSGRPGVRPRP